MRLLSPQKTEAAVDGRAISNARTGPGEREAIDTSWSDSREISNR